MIDLKNKDEMPTNVVICGSIAVFLIAAASMVLLPNPKGPDPASQRRALRQVKNNTDAMKTEVQAATASLAAETWPGSPEDIGPIALKQINGYIQARKLKLVGFHSDKSIEEPNVLLIPFVISVDGSFNSVMAFTRDLESKGTKLAVNLLQISNADQSDDKVTASIGVTAYQLLPLPPFPSDPVDPSKHTRKGVVKTHA